MPPSLPDQIQGLEIQAPLPETLTEGFQHFPGEPVADIGRAVHDALDRSGMLRHVQAGQSVAVGCGSRGIANLPLLIRSTVEALKARGANPFVFPAMGSHGGGTAAGQTDVLAHLGVTHDSMGAGIRSGMEVNETACIPNGPRLFQGCDSAAADHVILVNRIKPHTSFQGPVESGLGKMCVIGLGKMAGARAFHAYGARGFMHWLVQATRLQVGHTNVLGGIGVVENAREETIAVAGLMADEFAGAREQSLLEMARAHMPRVPVSPIDVLVVRRLGKEISGTGMDTNVIGRYGIPHLADADWPRITVIVVLGLTPDTNGNANGLGLANIISARVLHAVDWQATYTNALTAGVLGLRKAAMPVVMPNDRQALQLALRCIERQPAQARVLMIEDTLSLDRVWMSGNLAAEWASLDECELGASVPLAFAGCGGMTAPWSLA